MMDMRDEIIQKVTNTITGSVFNLDESGIISINDLIPIVQDAMVVALNDYDFQERCTDITVSDDGSVGILKKFITTKKIEGIADSTLRRYYDVNWRLIQFLQKPLNEITTYDLRYYLAAKRQEGKVSNRTLDGMRRCWSSFFGWMFAEGFIHGNPCLSLKQIKYKKTVKKPFSAIEMEKIRKVCKNSRDLALVDFMYSTGCRVSEIANLNIDDVDFEKRECIVTGKGNKERIVYLSEIATMNLCEYLKGRNDFSDALFVGRCGKRIGKNGIEAMLKRLGKKACVENAHPHRYRRTLATNLLDRGMNIQDVAVILGHADLKTTQIYCYISQSNVKMAYRKYMV